MTQTPTPAKARAPAAPIQEASPQPVRSAQAAGRKRRLSPSWRHFLEMLAAMAVGMVATGVIFLSIVDSRPGTRCPSSTPRRRYWRWRPA